MLKLVIDAFDLISLLTMKYLALLSGGKDSCYNLVHCAQGGHELVAAASLGPEPGKGPAYTQFRLLIKFTAP